MRSTDDGRDAHPPTATDASPCEYAREMFTGLIQSVGVVREVSPAAVGVRLLIDSAAWRHHPASGDSVSVAGCCLTVVQEPGRPRRLSTAVAPTGALSFEIVPETLHRTTLGQLVPGHRVNLEQAARAETLLGGHIVQGHIDGIGEVLRVESGREYRVRCRPPAELLPLIPPKGSIAVDGVSLTVASVGEDWFEIALIPTTLTLTTLGALRPGDACNIETDILARTVAHWLSRTRATS